ncbi:MULTISPECIES: carbohydrate ABC transporter permease [Enterococcus]|uniref:Sugar ABC transporter permease n=1 Tax=Enterococcus mundtii TaxID=53346 RepID=A0A1V2UM66_ENTMU|nr:MULTISPECIES: carbohydrate ABC transporter permease [Enterococcus]MBE9911764.1 carbohydrate ABC transporter permease [Enterococcus mundtii]MCA6773479.1 carbohydrate ABC transporter permease [Enterococcus mundtii]MDB7102727.1 carbohydrate ABC transporter permease [Enterococcus mundtii]ONN44490.1 sugar ABC transporter permease [Enterococcus mundtii]QCJ55142.1 carbohydrate ABC transporter permease [Enterococcus mundtii]
MKQSKVKHPRQVKKSLLIFSGLLLASLWFYPFFLVVINSFKTKAEIFQNTLTLPTGLTLDNYIESFERLDFFKSAANSLLITIGSLVLIVFVSSMAAYALSRNTSRLSSFLYFIVAIGLLIPFQGIMIPLISLFGQVSMLNQPGLMVMYLGLATSMSTFLYYGALRGIPKSLDEAALIDGANTFQIYWQVIFPLLKPTTVTVIVLNALWFWNDYLLPSLSINKAGMYTIPLQMFYFFGEFNKQWHLALAALVIVVLPIIILFVVLQKHVVKGISDGAVK